ncbi:MAG: C-GCAxxG-C-C family protein [Candidatus Bathyarchaeota archaeon]|nr:C-GCAxxG-C-C family protein [Candidatus Bathyarchaeota archaeon]
MENHKKELLDKAFELGRKYEIEYYGCSQCALASIQETLKIRNDDIFKSASALAGGLGVTGNGTCGTLSGAVMAIGQIHGRVREDFKDEKKQRKKAYELARILIEKFVNGYGSVICKDVQKKLMGRSYNLWIPEELKEFEKARGHTDKCPIVVGNTSKWAIEVLLRENS